MIENRTTFGFNKMNKNFHHGNIEINRYSFLLVILCSKRQITCPIRPESNFDGMKIEKDQEPTENRKVKSYSFCQCRKTTAKKL